LSVATEHPAGDPHRREWERAPHAARGRASTGGTPSPMSLSTAPPTRPRSRPRDALPRSRRLPSLCRQLPSMAHTCGAPRARSSQHRATRPRDGLGRVSGRRWALPSTGPNGSAEIPRSSVGFSAVYPSHRPIRRPGSRTRQRGGSEVATRSFRSTRWAMSSESVLPASCSVSSSLQARTHVDNLASRRVLERTGSQPEGIAHRRRQGTSTEPLVAPSCIDAGLKSRTSGTASQCGGYARALCLCVDVRVMERPASSHASGGRP
jgi:hypothetical protein